MLQVAVLVCCVVLTICHPTKFDHLEQQTSATSQGYDYEPPPQPSTLYQVPADPPSLFDTPAPPAPPPSPPEALYQTPLASNPQPVQQPAPNPTDATAQMAGMPYEFDWGVDDADSGNQYSQKEESDGNVVRGEYRVLLPDGRLQIVRYFDEGNGFNVDITYE